MIAMKSLIVRL